MQKISLVVTTLNEEDSIAALLNSILAQTRLPDELVIVDGGSTDRTIKIVKDFAVKASLPVNLIIEPGANISRGRNAGIAAAGGEIIASTDAGVRLHPDWLLELIRPFRLAANTKAVAGFFLPDTHSPFEVAMGATVLPLPEEINPDKFLPSSRSIAFERETFLAIGGYPEWLDYCEDLVFDRLLLSRIRHFVFAPKAIAYFHPRSSTRAYLKQYYRYARGDGKADLWRLRYATRYASYGIGLPAIILAGAIVHPMCWLIGGIIASRGLFWTPYRRLAILSHGLSLRQKIEAALWVPIIRVAGDMAKMIGYPVGLLWRCRNRKRPEIHWRNQLANVREPFSECPLACRE